MAQTSNVNVTGNAGLAIAEFGPSAQQRTAISSGCIARALNGPNGLSPQEKTQFQQYILLVRQDLAQAIDLIKSKQSRVQQQRDRLNKEAQAIGQNNQDFANFHRLGNAAISVCSDAAATSQYTKEGLDFLYSNLVEINYQLSLLDVWDATLSQDLDNYNAAMNGLDTMSVAISI
jgi:hypothetical protein